MAIQKIVNCHIGYPQILPSWENLLVFFFLENCYYLFNLGKTNDARHIPTKTKLVLNAEYLCLLPFAPQ